jgi:hypothetical protein
MPAPKNDFHTLRKDARNYGDGSPRKYAYVPDVNVDLHVNGDLKQGEMVAWSNNSSFPSIVALRPRRLGPLGSVLAFTQTTYDIRWDGVVKLADRNAVFRPPDEKSAPRRDAAELLKTALAGGPKRSSEIEALADQNGIAARTLKRAKRDLGVESVRVFDKKTKCFEWRMRLPGSKRSKDVVKRLKRVS